MPMIHHDKRDYKVAVSEAAKSFQAKIEARIHAAVPRVTNVLEAVQNNQPEDMVVAGKVLRFSPESGSIRIVAPDQTPLDIHNHAFGQICERTRMSHATSFLRDVIAKQSNGSEAVAEMLTRLYGGMNGDRFLLRAVHGKLLGFLSDQYRRLDSRPLVDRFLGAIAKYGAVPLDGFALDTKINLRALLPFIFEPFPGEVMVFGIQIGDSDFGDGKLFVSGFVERLYCTNTASLEDVLSQVHLGRRLSENSGFSEKTLQLDTDTFASAVEDVAGFVLAPPAIEKYCGLVRKANEEKIEPGKITDWVKKNLTKKEGEQAVEKFASPDVELLPPGQTKWRWSNALSWLANVTEDEHRKLEIQELAGVFVK